MTRRPLAEDEGTAVDHVEALSPREGVNVMPGYEAASRRLNKHGWNPAAAWRDGDMPFDPRAAEHFLQGPMAAVAKTNTPKDRGRVLTMCLAFALVAIEADREQRVQADLDSAPPPVQADLDDETPDGQDDRPPITF